MIAVRRTLPVVTERGACLLYTSEKILGAESKILAIEQEMYAALLAELTRFVSPIQKDASLVARLDCLLAFAIQSVERRYCRPEVNDSQVIDIKDGRHPVIETLMRVCLLYTSRRPQDD